MHHVPAEVGAHAVELHKSAGMLLGGSVASDRRISSELMRSPSWVVDLNWIEFASLEIRNQCVAEYLWGQFIKERPEFEPSQVFDVAKKIWRKEIGHPDMAAGRFLAIAYRGSTLLRVATALISSGTEVFDVLHCVGAALPYVQIDPEMLVELVRVQHDKTKNDYAGGVLFSAIDRVLTGKQEVAWEIYERTKADASEGTANLYVTALLSLIRGPSQETAISRMLMDAEFATLPMQSAALWAMARTLCIHEVPEAQRTSCIATIRRVTKALDVKVREGAIRALAHAATKHPTLIEDLLALSWSGDRYVSVVIADLLMMNFKELREQALFPELLNVLTGLPTESKQAIDNFDWILSQLVDDPVHAGLAYDCLTNWVVKNGNTGLGSAGSIEHFDSTIGELVSKPARLGSLLTRWLAADERELAAACGAILSFLWVRNFREPEFSKEVLDGFQEVDIKLLVRRMLGYVISEEALISLTFSLLKAEGAQHKTYALVHQLLAEEVGHDYIESTLEAIEKYLEVGPSPPAAMLRSAFHALLSFKSCIEKLPRLNELHPPLLLRRAIALRRANEMRESMDKADEKSIMRKLTTQIHLKAGRGWFNVEGGKVGPAHSLHSVSHEVRLPRRALVDPVGYAIAGLYFRISSREDE